MADSRDRKRKDKSVRIILAMVFITALAGSCYLIFDWWQEKRSGFAKYPGFGIMIPSGFDIHGIDVSHHQGYVKWQSVREMREKSVKLGFAFIKATEGYSLRDPQFKRNWRKAKEAGMPRGAYHFFLPHKSGTGQAEHFISTVKLEKGDLPPVLDIEETYGVAHAELRKRLKDWLLTVEKRYGCRPIIYTNADFYTRVLGSEFDGYPLWVAHYLKRDKPRIGRSWSFWQFSETGNVNGILSRVDFNVFNGDSADLREMMVD